jgi:hypothetical protein
MLIQMKSLKQYKPARTNERKQKIDESSAGCENKT